MQHYGISIFRRALQAHGKDCVAHGEVFAEGVRRRTADGSHRHGNCIVCRVSYLEHTAKLFAVCFFGYTAKKSKETASRRTDGVG